MKTTKYIAFANQNQLNTISNMGDLITLLQIIQKLNDGKLVTDQQVEHISQVLTKALQQTLSSDAWHMLYDGMLNSMINGNDENSTFIDLY